MIEGLIDEAMKARDFAYCPYSSYAVGACVETTNGELFTGCNIENASYGLTICAERIAVSKAVSDGVRSIKRIVIAGGRKGADLCDMAYPCGACRQVIREFANENAQIIVARSRTDFKEYTLKDLLPDSFGPDNLKE